MVASGRRLSGKIRYKITPIKLWLLYRNVRDEKIYRGISHGPMYRQKHGPQWLAKGGLGKTGNPIRNPKGLSNRTPGPTAVPSKQSQQGVEGHQTCHNLRQQPPRSITKHHKDKPCWSAGLFEAIAGNPAFLSICLLAPHTFVIHSDCYFFLQPTYNKWSAT